MGITVHYRGSLTDLDCVEDFEDRVLDLALSLGGEARIWRSGADDEPGRLVRGVMLDLYPGQETILGMSLGTLIFPLSPAPSVYVPGR